MLKLQYYTTEDTHNPVKRWLNNLRDEEAKRRISSRIRRLQRGIHGDSRSVGGAVRELRIHYGPGYRVYFASIGKTVILLLCAGSKKTQPADIDTAQKRLQDWKSRHGTTKPYAAES